MSIGIYIPRIGSVLGHPTTNALEPQHVKIVDMFSHHNICIKFPEEVQQYFHVVVWGNIKNHVPSVHPMVSNWLTDAQLNGNMWFATLWKAIRPRNSKYCINMFFFF